MALPRMITVACILPDLRGGGAERVVVRLLNALDRTRFRPILILIEKSGDYLDDVSPDVEIIDLKRSRLLTAIPSLIAAIYRIRPDVILASHGYVSLPLAFLSPFLPRRTRLVAREANTPSRWTALQSPFRRLVLSLLYRHTFSRYDRIVALSGTVKSDIESFCRVPTGQIAVIHNPVDLESIERRAAEPSAVAPPEKVKRIIAVGRLHPQKQYPMLIEAFSLLSDIPAHLTIMGDGPEKEAILGLVLGKRLAARVHLAGFIKNPYAVMRHADLLVLPSAFEGFPNALIEAHACGIPAVVFHDIGGASEIIIEGVNGLLARQGSVEDLAAKIRQALATDWDREKIRDSAYGRFGLPYIASQWERLFESF
ncbi:MAG TPA: glycosyltransferase [bacterium]|nr:glycosyltransferase [bacterium]